MPCLRESELVEVILVIGDAKIDTTYKIMRFVKSLQAEV